MNLSYENMSEVMTLLFAITTPRMESDQAPARQ